MKKGINRVLVIILSLLIFSACNQKKVAYNTPDQIEYMNRWRFLLGSYSKTENDIKKDELIEKCTQLFNEHKSFINWKGQVKEINSYDEYAQLIIAQMINFGERSSAEFHVKIFKSSLCYDLIKNLKANDEITFSGSIESELSITGNGKIAEPELEVICTNINGIENTSNESSIVIENSSYNNSSEDKMSSLVNESIANKYYYNDANGIYTIIKFEPVEGLNGGGMVLSQMQCNFAFSYEIIGNKIETEFVKSGCDRTSTNRTFYYDEANAYIYMDMDGQKFIFRNLISDADSQSKTQTNSQKVNDENVCTMCKGTGIEKNTAQHILGGEDGRVCPVCNGKVRQEY